MKERCNNPNDADYANYGAIGIGVHPDWLDLAVFHEWALRSGYQSGLSIDRIDTNGDYEPSNCRWATPFEQARNKRNNVHIIIDGSDVILADVFTKFGVSSSTLYRTIKKNNSSHQEAVDLLLRNRV